MFLIRSISRKNYKERFPNFEFNFNHKIKLFINENYFERPKIIFKSLYYIFRGMYFNKVF